MRPQSYLQTKYVLEKLKDGCSRRGDWLLPGLLRRSRHSFTTGCLLPLLVGLILLSRNVVSADEFSPLINQVSQIASPGSVGPVEDLIPTAMAWRKVVTGDDDTTQPSVFCLARQFGQGRVVALGHDGILSSSFYDNTAFLRNVAEWLNQGRQKRIAFTAGHKEFSRADNSKTFTEAARGSGFGINSLAAPITAQSLQGVDVLVVGNAWGAFSEGEVTAVKDFVSAGGGLLLVGLGWSWLSYNQGATLDNFPMAILAAPYGVRWRSEIIRDPTDNQDGSPIFHVFPGRIPPNSPPQLPPLPAQVVEVGSFIMLSVAATDPDVPANRLTYSLEGTAPQGASLDSSGLFVFTPIAEQALNTYTITIKVTDDGIPPLSAIGTLTVTVKAATPPPPATSITSQPQDLTAVTGGSATFRVEVNGQGAQYQWFFGNTALPGASESFLTLQNLTTQQAGSYWVRIDGIAGAGRSRDAQLTVGSPPVESKVELMPAGRWPEQGDGRCLSVRASGGRAYVAHLGGLSIFSVSNAAEPVLLGSLILPPIDRSAIEENRFPQMQLVGNLVYMARLNAGLQLVNVTDPSHPQLAGTYPVRSACDVQVIGSRAYIADDLDGLLILDVRDPGNIAPLGTALYPISRIRVAGAIAYGVYNHDFYTFNVANPAQITRLNMPAANAEPVLGFQWATDLEIAGRVGYVTTYGALVILNLDNPAKVEVMSTFNLPHTALSMDISGTTAYLGTKEGGGMPGAEEMDSASGLVILNLQNPGDPQVLSILSSTLGVTYDVQASDGYVYLADAHGLGIVQASNPALPKQVKFIGTAPGTGQLGAVNNRLLVPAGELISLDLSNPDKLTKVFGYNYSAGQGEISDFREVLADGQRVYAICTDPNYFIALDFTNPNQVKLLGEQPLGPAKRSFNIQLQGTTAYVSYERADAPERRLDILDVSNAASMRSLGSIQTRAPRLYVQGDWALGNDMAMWQLYDVSVPGQVQVIRDLDFQGEPDYRSLQMNGRYGYLASMNGLSILDLANKFNPVIVGSYRIEDELISVLPFGMPPQPASVYLVGIKNSAAGRAGFLRVLNVQDPRTPFPVAEYVFPTPAIRCLRTGSDLLVVTEDAIHRLHVTEGWRPVITQQPVSQTVQVGGQATFTVTAGGPPPLAYQWLKDGVALPGATSSSLFLKNVTSAQAGLYQVSVRNQGGEILSSAAKLTVTAPPAPPVLLTQPQDQEVTQGGQAMFQVQAESATPLTYQWQLNGSPLPNATGPMLILNNVSRANAGEYAVTIRNNAGTSTSQPAYLAVRDEANPPVILEAPQSLQAALGGTATFSVRADGTLPLTYQWFKNGQAIPGANQSILGWTSLQLADAGSYRVRVRNTSGQVLSDAVELTLVDASLLSETQLELLRKPDSLKLLIPGGRGTYTIYEGATADGLPGSPWMQGQFEGSTNLAWPLNLRSGQHFYQASLDLDPVPAPSQENDEPDVEEPAPDYLFHWETPSYDYEAGTLLEIKGTIADRSGQQLKVGGMLELSFEDAMTGLPMPGLTLQPAKVPITQGTVQATVQVMGTRAPDAQPRLVIRIQPILGSILPRTLQSSSGKPVEVSTPAPRSNIDDYRVTADGPWAAPLEGQPIFTGAFGEWPRGKPQEIRIHKGLDLRAPFGTKVFAAEKGIVIASSSQNGSGVTIYHGNGFATRYMHVTGLPHVRRGIPVQRGDPIGVTSLLGLDDPSQCHLHFEIHQVTEEDVAPGLKDKGEHVHQPGEEVNPIGNKFKYGFTPSLNGHRENKTDPQLDRAMLTAVNPATKAYVPKETAQDALADSANLRYLLLQVLHQSAQKTVVDELSVQPEGQPVTTIDLRNKSADELSSLVENGEKPGIATVPPSYKADWKKYKREYYRFWTSWDTSPYQGLNDGPKKVQVSLRSVADTRKSYELRYGAALKPYKQLETNPQNGKLKFQGEVVLYNGLESVRAAQQKSKIILECSPQVKFVEVSKTDWLEASDTQLTSKELATYGSKLTFRFEVLPMALPSCANSDNNGPWVKAYLPGLPAIVHQLPVQNPQPDFAIVPPYLEVEAGKVVVFNVVTANATGSPLGTATWQWSYRELKTGQTTTPVAMAPISRGSALYWYGIPFLVREKGGQFELLGRSQGLFELTVRDGKGGTACARVRVQKTLIELYAKMMTSDLEYPVNFLPEGGPVPTDGATVTISGQVVDQKQKPVPLCGSLDISAVDSEFFTSWTVEPSRLPIVKGQVSGQVKVTYGATNPRFTPLPQPEFRFTPYPPPLGTPPDPPALLITPDQQDAMRYTGWNQFERNILAWQGLSPSEVLPPESEGIGAYAIDLAPGEQIDVHLQSEGCEPFYHFVSWMRPDGLQYLMGGKPMQFGLPMIIKNAEGIVVSIRSKVTP